MAHCWLADHCQIQGFPHMIRNLGVKQVVNTGCLSALEVELYAIYLDSSKPRSAFGIHRQWTHSSTLAWKIPWMEEPGGLQFMGSLRVGHD